jgi:hypothetical protein
LKKIVSVEKCCDVWGYVSAIVLDNWMHDDNRHEDKDTDVLQCVVRCDASIGFVSQMRRCRLDKQKDVLFREVTDDVSNEPSTNNIHINFQSPMNHSSNFQMFPLLPVSFIHLFNHTHTHTHTQSQESQEFITLIVKVLLHWEHRNGRSPVCDKKCRLRWSLRAKAFLHPSQVHL